MELRHGDREDPEASPASKSGKIEAVFPWGAGWPPPPGICHYTDEETAERRQRVAETRRINEEDGYFTTAPVMSFPPNALGLYDMAGSTRAWCEDFYDGSKSFMTLRGASCLDGDSAHFLSSYRGTMPTASRLIDNGFRVVLEL